MIKICRLNYPGRVVWMTGTLQTKCRSDRLLLFQLVQDRIPAALARERGRVAEDV